MLKKTSLFLKDGFPKLTFSASDSCQAFVVFFHLNIFSLTSHLAQLSILDTELKDLPVNKAALSLSFLKESERIKSNLNIIFDGAGAHVELRHLREMIASINKHSLFLGAFPHVTANYIPNITRLIHNYMHDT